MNVENIIKYSSITITTKIVNISLSSPFFIILSTYQFFESFPKHNECERISGSFHLNLMISVALTNK